MNIKRIKASVGAFLLCALCLPFSLLFTGCGERAPDIVVTGYAQYDWTAQVLGENPGGFSIKYLLDSGVDLHSYSPSVADIASIGSCKLFIYTDSDAERWVGNALANSKNENRESLNLMSLLSKDEKLALDEESGHVHDENCDHEYDEHIWLSLKLAQKFVPVIADRLGSIDPENKELYQANAAAYIQKLADLDGEYQAAVDRAARTEILFADRYPFRYLANDYGLTVYAAFDGCSAETEASIATIGSLIGTLNELNLPVILVLEGSDQKLAQTLKRDSNAKNQQIVGMNSLQSVTKAGIDGGVAYLSVMEQNLTALRAALS